MGYYPLMSPNLNVRFWLSVELVNTRELCLLLVGNEHSGDCFKCGVTVGVAARPYHSCQIKSGGTRKAPPLDTMKHED